MNRNLSLSLYIYIYILARLSIYIYIYGHPPPITKTIQARRTRHAGHCSRSKDEIVSDVLLWTPAYGQSKAGRPARTYIQQLRDDTGYNPEDLPEGMNDRRTWRERESGISVQAAGHDDDDDDYIYMCVCVCVYVCARVSVCVRV